MCCPRMCLRGTGMAWGSNEAEFVNKAELANKAELVNKAELANKVGVVSAAPVPVPRCAACRYREDDRRVIERSVAGLAVMSSAFGASIGESRLCRRHDCLVSPDDFCGQFDEVD